MNILGRIHGAAIFSRRVRVLSRELAPLLPAKARVLDVGCGDGAVAEQIMKLRPDVVIEGVDIMVRPHTKIPVRQFDGSHLPAPDASHDVVMFVDVLHHTVDPMVLLREARRVAQRAIVIKDHLKEGFLAGPTLRFMDWVGNAPHGVVLPYNYWTPRQWEAARRELGVRRASFSERLGLYPFPGSVLFDRHLHMVTSLVFD